MEPKNPLFENVLVSYPAEKIALVIVNRPLKLNALNKNTISELHQVFKEIESNVEIRVVILTGSGEKAFVAGADISEFSDFSKEQGTQLAAEGQTILFDFIENFSKPVIAAVNGFALGGGLELAMACHFRYASENAKMGLPEVTLGLIPGYGGTQRLPQLIGKGNALEMMLSANMITADKALQLGLVNAVVPQADLISSCVTIAQKIVQNSPNALKSAIKAVNSGYSGKNGYESEIEAFGACFGTEEFVEGTTAFLSKRKAQF
jgi:enoyl-CoA hydratase